MTKIQFDFYDPKYYNYFVRGCIKVDSLFFRRLSVFVILILPTLFLWRSGSVFAAEPLKIGIRLPGITSAIRTMQIDSKNRLWIGTWNSGLWTVASNVPHRMQTISDAHPGIKVSKIISDNDIMWVATAGSGVIGYDIKSERLVELDPPPDHTMNYLHAILKPQPEMLFLGSVGSGAALLENGKWNYWCNPGLMSQWINDAVFYDGGILFAGDLGLSYIKNGQPSQPFKLSQELNLNTLHISNGKIYMGSCSDGVYAIDLPAGNPVKVRGLEGSIQAFADWKNHTWVCGDKGLGKICSDNPREIINCDISIAGQVSFKSLCVFEDKMLAGTIEGQIFETADSINFRLFGEFQNGRLIINQGGSDQK